MMEKVKGGIMMNKPLIKPSYYDEFVCSAGECPISCCQQWKIEVDEATYQNWKLLQIGEPKKPLQQFVARNQEGNTIELTKERCCPFLSETKLCNLVTTFGEEVLSHTCATFPREVHEFEERTEYVLATSCPEVVNLLHRLERMELPSVENETPLDGIRRMLMMLVQQEEISIPKALMIGFYLLLEIEEGGRSLEEAVEQGITSEQLEELVAGIDGMPFSVINTFYEGDELFLDIIYNYQNEGMYLSYLQPLVETASQYKNGYDMDVLCKEVEAFEQAFAAHSKLMRTYLAAELFYNGLMPGAELIDVAIKLQWITLEYAVIRHALFLQWKTNGKQAISYEMVQEAIVLIGRMTGYEDKDLYEYLIDHFEALVWEWGYLALVVGNENV